MDSFIENTYNNTKNIKECNGDGSCLLQQDGDIYIKNPNTICNYDCQLIECPNYILCKSIMPNSSMYHGMCDGCYLIFGKWNGGRGISEIKDTECVICLENKTCITQPKCIHFTCIECFKRCHYGDPNYDLGNKPIFPYNSMIENEYYDDFKNPKWASEYPLISIYNDKKNDWDDKQFENSLREEQLQFCPVCRQ